MYSQPFADRRAWRWFGSTFVLTVCALLLAIGFLVVDHNTRVMAQGTAARSPERTESDWWGESNYRALSQAAGEWGGRLWAVLPAEQRLELWAWDGMCQTAPIVLQFIGVTE